MSKIKIKKGDKVIVISGKDKGKSGEVLNVIPKSNRVLLRGVNIVKRHTAQSQTSQGGILDKELSSYVIDDTLSNDDNLMFIISLDGFYSLGKEKASNMAQSFKNVLDSSNTFKAVYFSPGKVVNKWKTSFSISLVL